MDKGDSTKKSETRQTGNKASNGIRVTRRTALQAAGAGALIGFGAQSVAADDVERTTVVEGDVASIDFSVSESEECLFTVGDSDESGYEVQLTIDPGAGGSMTLSMNTLYTAENDPDKIFSLSGGTIEDIEVVSDSAGYVLAPGEYLLDLSRDGSALARNRLEILPREEPEGITVWTAPNGSNIDDSSTFSGGISGSPFTQRHAIAIGDVSDRSDTKAPDDAYGDWLVIEVSATGIFGLLEEQSYENVDEMVVDGFFDLIVENTSNQELTQESLDIMSLYYDDSADRLYAVADTDDLTVSGGDYLSETVGETYGVQFVLTEEFTELFDTGEESVATRFDLIDREFEFIEANGTLEIQGESNETLPAETTVAPGTEIEFEADDEMLILEHTEATVNDDGTVDVVFDFSDAEEGEDIVIQAFDQGFENNAETVAALSDTQEEADDGELVIRDWGPREPTVEPGENEFVEVYIENTGQSELTGDVVVTIDRTTVAGEEVTLDGQDSTVIPLEFTAPDQPGEYEWYVQTEDDETESNVLTVDGQDHDDEDEHDDGTGEAVFEILHVEPTVETATIGDMVDVEIVIANTGDGAGETNLEIFFGDDSESGTVYLEAGHEDQFPVSFEAVTEGEHEVAAETEDDSAVASQIVTVEPGEDDGDDTGEAVFEILYVEPTVESAVVGDMVDVEVAIANTGDDAGETNLEIFFGDDSESGMVPLEPGHEDQFTVPFQTSTEGEYEVTAETEDDSAVASQTVMVESEEDEGDDTDDETGAGTGGGTDESPSEEDEADDSEEDDDPADDESDSEAAVSEEDDDDGLFSEGLLLAGGGIAAAAAAAGYAVKKRGLGGFGGSDEPGDGPHDGGRPGQGVQNQHPSQSPVGGRPPQQPPRQHNQQPHQQQSHQHQPAQQPPRQQQPPHHPNQQPPAYQGGEQQPPAQPYADQQQPPAHEQQPASQQPPEGHERSGGYQQSPPPAQPPGEQHTQYPDEYEQWRPPESEPNSQTPPAEQPASQSPPADHSQEPGQEPAQPPADEHHQSERNEHESPEESDNTEQQ